MKPSFELLMVAVTSRGSDADDPRDAAHEACHALDARMRGPWEREAIHRALERRHGRIGDLIFAEVRARAVEQIVCRDLGVDPHSVEHWATIVVLETSQRMHIALPGVEWFTDCVKRDMNRSGARIMADRILALRPKRSR